MRLQKYGLLWDVTLAKQVDSDIKLILKQVNGLSFYGFLEIHPVWGPYIYVPYALDKDKQTYLMVTPQSFYAEELLEFVNSQRKIEWYHMLHNGYKFPKSAFKEDYKQYRMSLATLLKNIDDAESVIPIVYNLLSKMAVPNLVSCEYYRKRPFMYIRTQIYEALPKQWTVHDIYNVLQSEYEGQKQIKEQLWNDMAALHAAKEPVKIPVLDKTCSRIILYAEKTTPYNINFPVIIDEASR